ncbi:MAG: hypothetical protein PHR26_02015 [Candidatus ainarchaeum sp.]|nr:hypothetical protein [Candidatus ainarchaeum sp.]MDD3976177.1 hypothetical protein [Candidatus ainarchaeum sp.]
MEFVFKVTRKVTDMENPSNNVKEEKTIYAEIGETFEDDGNNGHIFKILSGNSGKVNLEYDRHFLVKNEHKAYDYTTEITLGQTKQITSMWGRKQITITITFSGIEGSNDENCNIDDNKSDFE